MLVVVIDCATPAITAAAAVLADPGETTGAGAAGSAPAGAGVARGGPAGEVASVRILAQRRTVDGRAHGERLAPQIEAVLREAGVTMPELDAIVAGLGPGPFTGLRVGLVTAAALADAREIPVYGVCSLDAIGLASAGRVVVATDARRHEVYWGGYADGIRIAGPAVGKPAELDLPRIPEGFEAAVGDGALLYRDVLASVHGLAVRDEPRYPPPRELVALAAERIRAKAPSEILTPIYLRRPDATAPGPRKSAIP